MGDAPRSQQALDLALKTPRNDRKTWMADYGSPLRDVQKEHSAAYFAHPAAIYTPPEGRASARYREAGCRLGMALKLMGDAPRSQQALDLALKTPRNDRKTWMGIQQRILRIRQQFILLQKGEHQRVIAKRAAVIGHRVTTEKHGWPITAARFAITR
jgi:uncharacterized protein YfaS (alpha-2-macroglobulin family)